MVRAYVVMKISEHPNYVAIVRFVRLYGKITHVR